MSGAIFTASIGERSIEGLTLRTLRDSGSRVHTASGECRGGATQEEEVEKVHGVCEVCCLVAVQIEEQERLFARGG